jgi:predicted metal-dependent HD superfamily phosphohydrolase
MSVSFDDHGFGTDAWKIRWSEVIAVGIRTTACGPFAEDLFWQFLIPGDLVEIPGGVVDAAAVAAMQRQLPGIDSLKIVSAMGTTDNRVFRLWHVDESRSQWNDAVFGSRFAALVGRLGGDVSRANDVFLRLRAAWSAKSRRYHDLEHLADCLRELDATGAEPGIADVAELALWYHDAVYEPGAPTCEERSATLLCEDSALLDVPHASAVASAECVRSTAHVAGKKPTCASAELVVDVDLSILGRDVLRFLEFEYAVEEEYASVPSTMYFLARGRFLEQLLASPVIFRTDHFRERYEANARSNITALLRSPRYRAHRWLGSLYGYWLARFIRSAPSAA